MRVEGGLLTRHLHDPVAQEGATALQVAKALDVQRPNVSCGVAIRHPLCQVPLRAKTRMW